MTDASVPRLDWPAVFTSIAVVGSSAVFLLAVAVLLNALARATPLPPVFQNAAALAHLGSVLLALPLGVSQLVLPKGTARHRVVGYLWIGLMVVTALASFAVHTINPGGLSLIHLFSVQTLISAPLIVVYARTGRVARHRAAVLGLILGGLVIAGLFTFIPGRAMGELLHTLLG
jgi:uncharacterized membrane protein